MTKICIEICIISARGLSRKSPLLKPQWFAVGWIEPDSKYCTKIDASGSPNPTWKTKFSISVDETDSKLENMVLTIEVYRREPIFLRERLHGAATVMLQEFLDKYRRGIDKTRSGFEETASFQLRKRNSGKPKGFVDASVRISNEEPGSTLNSELIADPIEGITYSDQDGVTLAIEDGPVYTYPSQPQASSQTSAPHKIPKQPTHPYSYTSQPHGEYRPPFNAGTTRPMYQAPAQVPESYINVAPSSRPIGPNRGPGFGMGLGAGALAAGAMIFGEDFVSATNLPSGFDGASVIVSTDPLF